MSLKKQAAFVGSCGTKCCVNDMILQLLANAVLVQRLGIDLG